MTTAVVLRLVDFGEADRVVTLMTQARGKVSALARGARRSQKRFGAGLSLLAVGEAVLLERPSAELAILERIEGAREFSSLASDVIKMAHASYAAELVRELSPPHQAEPTVMALLIEFLRVLDLGAASAERLRVFELQLLSAVGLLPELEHWQAGGAVEDDVRAALMTLSGLALEHAHEHVLPRAINTTCRVLLNQVVVEHLGRTLKSYEFLEKMRSHGR